MEILKKKILDPQLHQIFKPIRKFFCNFLPPSCFNLRSYLKHIIVSRNLKTKKVITHFHFHFFFSKFMTKKLLTFFSYFFFTSLLTSQLIPTRLASQKRFIRLGELFRRFALAKYFLTSP